MIQVCFRMPKRLVEELDLKKKALNKTSGVGLSRSDVVRMCLERGLSGLQLQVEGGERPKERKAR